MGRGKDLKESEKALTTKETEKAGQTTNDQLLKEYINAH